MGKKRTHEEFINEMKEKHPNIEVLGEYKGNKIKLLCRCRVCEHTWEPRPSNLLTNGTSCPVCYIKTRRVLHEDFVKQVSKNIVILGEYTGRANKIRCKCKKCGHIWEPPADRLMCGHGCPKCAGKIKRTNEEFLEELKRINPNIEILNKYIKHEEKLLCRCKTCGNEWSTTPRILLKGCGCPPCSIKIRAEKNTHTHTEFINSLYNVNPNIEILEKYKNARTKIKCRCKKCGYEWSAVPGNLLFGSGCLKCNMSKGENQIEMFLKNNGIDYVSQKKYKGLVGVGGGLLSYDFYLPIQNVLIEYQGQFHDGSTTQNFQTEEQLKQQQEHDNRKREYAKSHNIKLLEIWYYDFDNIENILESRLLNRVA